MYSLIGAHVILENIAVAQFGPLVFGKEGLKLARKEAGSSPNWLHRRLFRV